MTVALGGLTPADVRVEVVHGSLGHDGDFLSDVTIAELQPDGPDTYAGEIKIGIAGSYGVSGPRRPGPPRPGQPVRHRQDRLGLSRTTTTTVGTRGCRQRIWMCQRCVAVVRGGQLRPSQPVSGR